MALWHSVIEHLSLKRSPNRTPLFFLSAMLLFWTLYEGMISYLTPIAVEHAGYSKSMIGVILGSSSIAGAVFDVIACRVFRTSTFRRMFLIVFVLCLSYPIILFQANTFVWFLLAMGVWGIYYDLKDISNLDFVARFTQKHDHAGSFGILGSFQAAGFLLGPLIAGIFLAQAYDFQPFAMALIFLSIAFVFFLALLFVTRKQMKMVHVTPIKRIGFSAELVLWSRLGRVLFPILFFGMFLNVIDAFFWTIGPLIAESFSHIKTFSGLFMTAYSLPSLLIGWWVGSITKVFGKKRTAFLSLLVGSAILIPMAFLSSPVMTIGLVFIASFFISLSWPSIAGAVADYVSEADGYAREIETLSDYASNLGYIVGPILAGFVADRFSNTGAFFFLGVLGVLVSLALFVLVKQKINVLKQLPRVS
ncbi:MFS transporter [Candidatus Uhrbacteria bacterium]|nr:MFS transporter [Candidatus Uhrbacteria bacterium]